MILALLFVLVGVDIAAAERAGTVSLVVGDTLGLPVVHGLDKLESTLRAQ